MGKLSAVGMAQVKAQRQKRIEALTTLIREPFDISKPEHAASLAQYTSHFELSVNQMYLFQAMNSCLMAWSASWVVSRIVPIPDFINSILATCLYLGVSGFILERFSMSDFHVQLEEMQQIYNWCLKNGQDNYSPSVDNTEKLAHPDIQRMIRLMAPLCNTDFMVAWQREIQGTTQSSGLFSWVTSSAYSAATSTYSLFAGSKQPSKDQLSRILDLKIGVEKRELDKNTFTGLEQSLLYFTTNPEFRSLLTANVTELVASTRDQVTSTVMSAVKANKNS